MSDPQSRGPAGPRLWGTLPSFREALRTWYARVARPLPWRADADPYRVWVSEVMLQQTTVAAVVPYYERFLAAFPTAGALADAGEADVLKLWEGLGYYSRARNLHAAARAVVARGGWPRTVAGLRELPGVGRYTAGAVASFAFGVPAPIVEANTLRLYARLLCYDGDPRVTAGQRVLWEFADRVVQANDPGTLNQALMELGGTVCTPKAPACGACPVSDWCGAFAAGRQHEIPPPKVRPKVTAVTEATVAVRRADGAVLIRRRGDDERWAGLWDFPRFEPPAALDGGRPPGRPPAVAAGPRRRPAAGVARRRGAGADRRAVRGESGRQRDHPRRDAVPHPAVLLCRGPQRRPAEVGGGPAVDFAGRPAGRADVEDRPAVRPPAGRWQRLAARRPGSPSVGGRGGRVGCSRRPAR